MEQKSKTRTDEGAAITDAIFTIFRANGRLLRAGDILGREVGITSARWQVLGAIDTTPKTVAQIAREFELTRQGVLPVVRALEKSGLVELVDNPNHRRANLVQLTRKGQTVYREMTRRQVQWANDIGAQFTLAELKKAIQVFNRMGEAIRSHPMTREAFRQAP